MRICKFATFCVFEEFQSQLYGFRLKNTISQFLLIKMRTVFQKIFLQGTASGILNGMRIDYCHDSTTRISQSVNIVMRTSEEIFIPSNLSYVCTVLIRTVNWISRGFISNLSVY